MLLMQKLLYKNFLVWMVVAPIKLNNQNKSYYGHKRQIVGNVEEFRYKFLKNEFSRIFVRVIISEPSVHIPRLEICCSCWSNNRVQFNYPSRIRIHCIVFLFRLKVNRWQHHKFFLHSLVENYFFY